MEFNFSQEPDSVLRRIKLRKRIPLSEMLNLIVGCDCDRTNPKPQPVCFLQDTLIKGRIGFDFKEKSVSYRANCPIPIPGFGSVELNAQYSFHPDTAARRYSYGIQLGTSHVVSLLHKGEADVTVKSPLNKRVGFEIHAHVKRPGMGIGGGANGFRFGDGALQVRLDEANAIIYV